MKYHKTITLKDGRSCVVRNASERDAQAVLDIFLLTHAQTDYLASYPEESTLTAEQEREFMKKKEESGREVMLAAEIDGVIAGTAGIGCVRDGVKTAHRASFGISVDQAWWGLGIGRALTEACIECAWTAGYAQLELEAVADNARALSLYTSAGFQEYGRNPRGFRTREGGWQELVSMRLERSGL